MAVTSQPAIQDNVLGTGEAIWYGNRATIAAGAASTGGRFALVELVVAPGHGPRSPSITSRFRR